MSCDEDILDPIVIDNGTWMCKAGYAGGKTARAYEYSILGSPKHTSGTDGKSEFIGEQAWIKRDMLALRSPMERGEVTNWDDMERFWEYIFTHELRDTVEDRAVLITEVPNNNKENRHKMVQILIEKFKVSSLYISDPATLALFSNGRTTGVVLDVGGSVTHTAPLYKGSIARQRNEAANDCPERSNIGGNDVTQYLANLLRDQGMQTSSSKSKLFDIEQLKHFLTTGSHQTDQSDVRDEFKLPDNTVVKILPEMTACSDILFNPSMIDIEAKGISTLLYDAIAACDPLVQRELYSNVILTGGATMMPGITERVQKELQDRVKSESVDMEFKIIAPPERRKSSWIGGSIIASLSEFPNMCKTKRDYFEGGWMEFLTFKESDAIKNS